MPRFANTVLACMMIFVLSVMQQPQEPLEEIIYKKYTGVYLFYSKYKTPDIEDRLKQDILTVVKSGDKIVHFALYGCLSLVFLFDYAENRRKGLKTFAAAFLFAFGISLVYEICQRHVPTRSFSYDDILTNFLGASLTMLISYLIHLFYARRKPALPHGPEPRERHKD